MIAANPSARHLRTPSRLPIASILLGTLALLLLPAQRAVPQAPASDQAVQQRVDDLLKQMTLEEKLGQLNQLFVFGSSAAVEENVKKGQVGSLLFVTDPTQINSLQHLAVDNSRLHIPVIFGFDVIHGFRTIFPVPIAMAASWDPSLSTAGQAIAAQEARSVGIQWAFAPMVDIARDPRWGRIVEGAGEDPYLGSKFAAAQVRGFQGDYIGAPGHVLACVKHFAGYGAAEGGRDYDASYISETQLHNLYLRPFHAAVQAGVGSVMSAYMDLNDVPATGNRFLLHDTLRTDWGFQGFVVSDADAVKSLVKHGFAKDDADAAYRALDAGVNMEMAIGKTAFSSGLPADLKAGLITPAQIDTAVRPILEMKIRLGLFENPYVDVAQSRQVLADPTHRTAARLAAERTAVLLRNAPSSPGAAQLLPLQPSAYQKIAVLGPLADSKMDTLGSWTFQFDLPETVTVLEGLRSKIGSQASLAYAPGAQLRRVFPSFFDALFRLPPVVPWTAEQSKAELDKAVALAASSDLSILVLGEAQNMSGEAASRDSLDLPGQQQQLLEAVVATGKPVILVLMNGRPLNITWASQHVPAILEAWYPGTQGGNAIANLLTGSAVPGGKLPISWPRNVGQIPINYAHNTTQAPENQGKRYWDEQSTPLYPFGYGLSYTSFAISNLKLSRDSIQAGQSLEVTADVENTGSMPADEVPQLYLHQQYGSTSRPVRQLEGFERITLAPHQARTVHFTIGKDELTYWSTTKKAWTIEPSTYDVWIGADSAATLHSSFTVAP
jgi:beta-glucosidase